MSGDGPPGWVVDLEVLALSLQHGRLHHRLLTQPVPPGVEPHEVAVQLAGADPGDAAVLCHSTSWRQEGPSRLVLTYVLLPDSPGPGAEHYVPSPIVAATDPASPQPEEVEVENVLAHALRHLAMLSREDPTIRRLVPLEPPLWEAIRQAAVTARTEQEKDSA